MIRPLRAAGTILAALLFAFAPARALQSRAKSDVQPPKELPADFGAGEQPWMVRMMIHDLKGGMFIALPVIDTNPNKGTTYGVMPIWVIQAGEDKRIKFIHAPSMTYNPTFKWEATARHYYYPTEKASYFLRGALSGNKNRDLIGEMEDRDFLGRDIALAARLTFDIDGSKRFYGLGPGTRESAETNYLRRTFGYTIRLGLPIFRDSGWKFHIGHHLAGEQIENGVVSELPGIATRFPSLVTGHFHQDSEFKFFVDYDKRDNPLTTSKGTYAMIYLENSQPAFGSEFSFQKYGADLRAFLPWRHYPFVTALRLRYDQIQGQVPFYLLPSLGGKEIHRAYGDGRFRDNGMWTATMEHRVAVYEIGFAGVTTIVEVTPFAGVGTVFGSPKRMAARYLRPVFGTALRAIARPQVVGSLDLGFGQEGGSIFMDINYSF